METDGVSEAASATRAGAVPRPAWRQTEAGHCLRAGGGLSRVVPGGDRIQGFLGIIGSTPVMLRLYEKIQMYAAVEAPVLITGETGTGKELVARAIHQASSRARRAFVTVNCSALTESLVESELFGHERGSFTGAAQTHRGRFERAHTGTIFLDEIGDMPLNGQAKLLRVLEEGSLERVGGEKPIPIDVRVVAATNVELEAAAAARRFRPDLFYRLEVLRLRLPPLRERLDDIGLLADHFIDRFNEKYGRNVRGITGEALALLASYSWPGNVREFRNLFERVFAEQNVEVLGRRAFQEWAQERAALAHRGALDPRVTLLPFRAAIELPSAAMPEGRSGGETVAAGADQGTILLDPVQVSLSEPVSVPGGISARAGAAGAGWRTGAPPPPIELTAVAIREAFQACGGNLTQAAARLGVHKATLYRRLKALGISRDDLAR